MRLLTVTFFSSAQFLSHYSAKHPDGAVFYRTRTDLEVKEPVLIEISFSGLPNRVLIRGHVLSLEAGKGAWLTFDPADSSTRDFLLQLARGEVEVTPRMERAHSRFPTQLPVTVERTDGADSVASQESATASSSATSTTSGAVHTGDLSASGVFVRTASSPPVGTQVRLLIDPNAGSASDATGASDAPGTELSLEGAVAWINDEGFGVQFADNRSEDSKRLRALLRRASETGRAGFVGKQ